MKNYVMELVGTFFLVFTIALAGQPLAIGFMLAALIYVGGNISGGHYNPAVTFAVWLKGKLNTTDAAWYIGAQLVAGFLAAGAFNFLAQSNFTPAPLENVKIWEAILLEALFTFVLCSVVLTLTLSKAFKNNHITGLVVGLTLASIIMAAGQVTGGAFNPAAGVGPLLFEHCCASGANLKNILVYLVGPLFGGFVASSFYCFIHND